MNKPGPVPGRERVAKRRAALRAQGLRLKQFWVPDVHSPAFKEQARRECEAINRFWADHPEEWVSIQALQYWPPDDPVLKRGDVVIIATGGGFGGKPRPALIVQSDKFADVPTLVVAPFTSELSDARVLRLRFQPDSGNGLRETSDLMTDILVTARRDQVGSVIGSLSPEDMARIDRALLVFLGLAG